MRPAGAAPSAPARPQTARRSAAALAAALTAAAGPVAGQSTAPSTGADTIPFAEFRAMVDGKTLYFELEDGRHWGREYYVPGTQNSVFIFADGECFEGYWTYDETYYCYHYREESSCWVHFWDGDRIAVESRSGMRQIVGKIAEQEPLSCTPDLISAAPPQGPQRFAR